MPTTMLTHGIMALALAVGSAAAAWSAEAAVASATASRFEPTAKYERREVEGWPVRISSEFARQPPALLADTLKLLGHHLYQASRVVPADALQRLKSVVIWIEVREPHHPCMCYHPDAGWLRDNGMNPDKARGVEIANAATFSAWSERQPWMVLHELAHAYHHQFLPGGFENAEVRDAYRRAIAAKLYGVVLYGDGRQRQSYAATNPQEFFAESSEAFFGTNDFYPFVRAELLQYDPTTHALLTRLWGIGHPADHGHSADHK
ncbi:MAG: hypothetical protein K8T25_20950 [Planctomycetia bacterium]|nr:hypothetical protein [Planctomycetia bacterium]